MNYWPGTKIPVSQNNAFTSWKTGESQITSSRDWKASEAAKRQMHLKKNKPITLYSRAKA